MEMTGTCIYCGQTRMVDAENQSEADTMASELCTCDNPAKKERKLRDNIEKLCGEGAKEFGMKAVNDGIKREILRLGLLCLNNDISAASLKISDSTITIKPTTDFISVSRKKVLSVELKK